MNADGRLILVRVKIERAKEHLRDLAAELLAARNVTVPVAKDEAGLGPKFQGKFGCGPPPIVILPRLPFSVPVLAGEIVHSLRSGLDHLVYQLAWVAKGSEPTDPHARRIGFPIAETVTQYEAEKSRKIQDVLRPEAIEAIDRLKPYKGGNDPLWRVHELDNIGKHRTLFTVAHDFLFFADWIEGDFWFKADTPHFSGVFDQQVEHDMQLELDKAVSEPKVPSGNTLLPSLHNFVDVVEDLVLGFKPMLE
jgi:hypothetical protein